MLNVSCLKYFTKYKYILCKCCTISFRQPELVVLNISCVLAFVAWGRGNWKKYCLNCAQKDESKKGINLSPTDLLRRKPIFADLTTKIYILKCFLKEEHRQWLIFYHGVILYELG